MSNKLPKGKIVYQKQTKSLPKTIQTLLTQPSFNLGFFLLTQTITFHHLCQCTQQWTVRELYLSRSKNQYFPLIIRDLSLSKFPELTFLNIRFHNIESIEQLGRIFTPKLSRILLFNNKITNLRDFRKANWKNLKGFPVQGNLISSVQDVCSVPTEELTDITIESLEKHSQSCDISWLGKLKSLKLSTISVTSNIKQKQLEACLKRKYSNIKFVWD